MLVLLMLCQSIEAGLPLNELKLQNFQNPEL